MRFSSSAGCGLLSRLVFEINEQNVDAILLALLYLTTFQDNVSFRAWKSHSWDVLDHLHANGYIDDPRTKAKSVLFKNEVCSDPKFSSKKHFAK